jgi:hypothetical protein
MSRLVFKPALRDLLNETKRSLSESHQEREVRRLALFVCFLIFIIAIYTFLWTPLVNKMENTVYPIFLITFVDLEITKNADIYSNRIYSLKAIPSILNS